MELSNSVCTGHDFNTETENNGVSLSANRPAYADLTEPGMQHKRIIRE